MSRTLLMSTIKVDDGYRMKRIYLFMTAVLFCLSLVFTGQSADAQDILPSPNLQTIKRDLQGRIIQQAEGGYFYSDWYLEIGGEDTKLCDVKVIDRQRKNRDLSMILLAQVRYRNTYFNTTLELSYRLGDNLVWHVNFLRTIDIVPVNPGKYDSCITLSHDNVRTYFTNSSDISLLVGGTVVSYSRKERYIVEVEPFTAYTYVLGNASVDFVIPATY